MSALIHAERMIAGRRSALRPGFALLLVLLVLAMSVVLGLSYLSSAAIRLHGSGNALLSHRAKYLAESGLQHGLYLLRNRIEELDGRTSLQSALGPFYVDDSSDSYWIYAQPGLGGRYVVVAEAAAGGIKRRSSATVWRAAAAELALRTGMECAAAEAYLPSCVTVNGNVYIDGNLTNLGRINGDVTAGGTIDDVASQIMGAKYPNSPRREVPQILVDQYKSYKLYNQTYLAQPKKVKEVVGGDPLNNGGAVTADNPAGVVWIQPDGVTTVKLRTGVQFTGTMIIQGNLLLDSSNIRITPKNGFPALVVEGALLVRDATDARLEGLVVATGGIQKYGAVWPTWPKLLIEGGLLCQSSPYGALMEGFHQVTEVPERCRLYDYRPATANQPAMEIIAWHE